jgi:hypothetical protein
MNKKILLCSGLIFVCLLLNAQIRKTVPEKLLKTGMVIQKTPGLKREFINWMLLITWTSLSILIDGYDITVDFNNATLQGSNAKKVS